MRTAAIGRSSNVTILTRPGAYGIPEIKQVAQLAARLSDKQAIAGQHQLSAYRHGIPLQERQVGAVIKLVESAASKGART
jgi:hypothetical protein